MSSMMIMSLLSQELVLSLTAGMDNTDLKENMHAHYVYVVLGINSTN
jgi:hypothetical protein